MRITDLEAGETYTVRDSFTDDAGVLVLPGDRMTFERYRVTPDGAFELTFREETLTVHEDRQPDVCEHAEWFLAPA